MEFFNIMERLARRLIRLPRASKRALMLLADVVFIPAALWSAMALKFGAWPTGMAVDPWLYGAAIVASVPFFVRLGLYRAVIRFIGPRVIVAVLSGVTASVLVLAAINLALGPRGVPFTALVVYWALALV